MTNFWGFIADGVGVFAAAKGVRLKSYFIRLSGQSVEQNTISFDQMGILPHVDRLYRSM